MTNIRRYHHESYVYFVTNVKYQRQPILQEHVDLLLKSIDKHAIATSSDLIAWVILPDHFHLLIQPPDVNISLLMRRIKLSFSSKYRQIEGMQSGRLWQYRFRDHVIRNQEDMNKHIDYIHRNPIKHGLVSRPFDYPHSSIHLYRESYPDDWGVEDENEKHFDFGE